MLFLPSATRSHPTHGGRAQDFPGTKLKKMVDKVAGSQPSQLTLVHALLTSQSATAPGVPIVGRRAAELTEQFVSGPYRFVEIEGGGHFIVDQFPDYIAQLLIEHIRSTSL
jgi:hypothetical protein